MTLDELDRSLLNGFYDAKIHSAEIDYRHATVALHVSFLVGSPDDSVETRNDYRRAVVRVKGLCFCAIDAPDPNYRFITNGNPITVVGDPAKPDYLPSLPNLMAKLPEGSWCYRLFVHDWNSFIHIAARDAEMEWVGERSSRD